MTDRGTYIKYQSQKGGNAPLKVLVEGDDILLNQYSVLTLNPEIAPVSSTIWPKNLLNGWLVIMPRN